MNAPLIRTMEQAERVDRERRAKELKQLLPPAVARGWVTYPAGHPLAMANTTTARADGSQPKKAIP